MEATPPTADDKESEQGVRLSAGRALAYQLAFSLPSSACSLGIRLPGGRVMPVSDFGLQIGDLDGSRLRIVCRRRESVLASETPVLPFGADELIRAPRRQDGSAPSD